MTDEFTNGNNNLNDSSINKAKFTEEEFGKQEKIRKLKEAAEEIKKHANKKCKEIENEAYDYFNSLLSNIDLNSRRIHSSRAFDSEFYPEEGEDEGYFTDSIVDFLTKLFKFFNFMESEIGFDADSQAYVMAMEEKKQNLIAAIMKLIRDRVGELIRKILSKDLSFKEGVEKEIKELWERIKDGDLSQEEEAAILERLQTLENLKLRLQMFAVGWVIVILSELLSVELKASVEIEAGKEEKTVSKEKETTKEVRENVEAEVKVTEKEMPKIIVSPSIFDLSSGVARLIHLTPEERDLLPNFLRNGLPTLFKDDMNRENREASKQNEVKGKQKNKQAEPKKEVSPPKSAEQPRAKELRESQQKRIRRFQDGDKNKKLRREDRDEDNKFSAHSFPANNWQDQAPSEAAEPPRMLTDEIKIESYAKAQSIEKDDETSRVSR